MWTGQYFVWPTWVALRRTSLQDAQKDRPARPQRVKGRSVPLGYVEGLNEARTRLADFFSSLLEENRHISAFDLHLVRLHRS